MQKTYRLFKHEWSNEYLHSVHHILMLEFKPYFTEDGIKRVKLEGTDFTEVGIWEGDKHVGSWNKVKTLEKDLSREEANAAWAKAKNVKYVTQNTPKAVAKYIY